MSGNWISALAKLEADGDAAVMITVVDEKGSTPRNAGAKMVVSAQAQFDTIGGGHLEYKAIKIARQILQDTANSQQTSPRLERFSLGASLGQCCGGSITLLFEPIGITTTQIALFGAGHVGRALAPILASLPCRVRWIDSRDDEFPDIIPAGVEKVVNEFPVDEVDNMPANSYFIVMTHNHQLDQQLSEAILKRADFDYYGLIGSITKRKKFEHRLKAKGFTEQQLERMSCPMGVKEVKGKLPAEIAVSVAGEVIATYSAQQNSALDNNTDHSSAETSVIERLAI